MSGEGAAVGDHDPDTAAAQLGVTRWWIKRHITEIPHQRYGNRVRFTDAQIAEIRAMFEQRPAGDVPPPPPAGDGVLRPTTRRRAS